MISALSLLTVFGRGRAPDTQAFAWFPLVGLLTGAVVAATHWGAHHWWSPLVAAGLVVAVDLVITGGLHLDGTADSADGLLPHLDRARRLEVMADPATGAFGVTAVVVMIGLRWAALSDPQVPLLVIAVVWAVSRTVVAVVPAVVAYARPGGLAQAYAAGARRRTALWLLPLLALAVAGRGDLTVPAVLVAVAAGVAAAVALVGWARRRIGGFTGDVLGACVVLSETVALVVLVARP